MRTLSLDAPMGTAGRSFLAYRPDDRTPGPVARAATGEAGRRLADRLQPRDAAAVQAFLAGGDRLPADVADRLRDTHTRTEVAALLGVDHREDTTVIQNTKPAGLPPGEPFSLSDEVWRDVAAVLARLDPPNKGPDRADPRRVLEAAVMRITGSPWPDVPADLPHRGTVVDTMGRWVRRKALGPAVDVLTAHHPWLTGADWSRVMTAADAAAFTGRVRPAARAAAPAVVVQPAANPIVNQPDPIDGDGERLAAAFLAAACRSDLVTRAVLKLRSLYPGFQEDALLLAVLRGWDDFDAESKTTYLIEAATAGPGALGPDVLFDRERPSPA